MAELTNATFNHVVDIIRHNLTGRHATRLEGGRAASVVVAVHEADGAAQYCLIKRAKRGRNAGQWALPGGKVEAGETRLEAGLREAEEEVALPGNSVQVLGCLDDFAARSGFVISAFVVAAPIGWRPTAVSSEVQRAYEFPVAELVSDDVVQWARVDDGSPLLQLHIRAGTRIHAPTGGILWQFGQLALLGREVSVAGLRQPGFTRR